eukprot:Clim_evm17s203 gene=Clim_evmTU17s203
MGVLQNVAIGISLFAGFVQAESPWTDGCNLSADEETTFDTINDHRDSEGLQKMYCDQRLQNLCEDHSRGQADNKDINHDGFSDRVTEMRDHYSINSSAENVAYGYSPVDVVTNGWLRSSGHRTNIENGVFNVACLGIEDDSDGTPYYTQIFLRINGYEPQSAPLETEDGDGPSDGDDGGGAANIAMSTTLSVVIFAMYIL